MTGKTAQSQPYAGVESDLKARKNVTAAVIKRKGKILICQRAQNDECGMQWEFPGGKQEDETLEQCIVREIKEELDLDIATDGIFATSIYHFGENEIHFTVFNAEIVSGEIKLNVHNDAKWVSVNELDSYEFMPADVEFVERIKKECNRFNLLQS